jgi:hypothetical protein
VSEARVKHIDDPAGNNKRRDLHGDAQRNRVLVM